jgi:hypothetical protein
MTTPAAGATVYGAFTVEASASDDVSVEKVRFWLNGAYAGYDAAAPYTRIWNSSYLPDGTHTVRVQAVDHAGNVAEATASFTLNKTGLLGVRPWAITQATRDAAAPGDSVVLTYDASAPTGATILPLRLDGSGSTVYEDAARTGSTSFVCAQLIATCNPALCPAAFPGCAETSPDCDGFECNIATGNLVGPTRDAIDFMLDNTHVGCDTFIEAVMGPVNGEYSLAAGCTPGTPAVSGSYRVLILPVVPLFASSVDVVGFSLVWLEGYGGACTGTTCSVTLRFIDPNH